MNFAIPRNNKSEMLLYIWKIIDLPYISQNELVFKISFDLFLFHPEKAKEFITNCIESKFLVKDNNQYLKLSKELSSKLENWQKKRKNEILKKSESIRKIESLSNDIDKKGVTNFNILINTFTDKGTLNRSVSVSDDSFELLSYDLNKGIISSKVKGTKEDFYLIELDLNMKELRHNCHDFITRRAENKKFCKHLVKLFLLLKDQNSKVAEFFLNKIAEDIDNWDFSA
ncbi:MAG: DUF2240 family protein [Promethearchaeota archaeon]